MPETIAINPAIDSEARADTGTTPRSWRQRLAGLCGALPRTGRLVCGIPDYETYVAHHRAHHPDRPLMSYEAFFRQRLEARYGGNGNPRCC